jgi:CheY-like chemotaxis protein
MLDQIFVLVAEDEELVRLVIVEAPEDAGFEVMQVEHAEAALGVLQIRMRATWLLRVIRRKMAQNRAASHLGAAPPASVDPP